MIWLGWRQQRTETVIAAVVLGVLALVLIPTGLSMSSAYHRDGLAACLAAAQHGGCGDAVAAFTSRFGNLRQVTGWLTLVPGLIGILLAAPFVTQLEQGTYRLDWTQSITRGRWIAGKLGLAVATAASAAVLLALMLMWWHGPLANVQGRVSNAVYDSEGTVVLAYTLFALGLAVAVGAVWRRAVPSLVLGLVGYAAVRVFVDVWLRQRLVSPATATWSVTGRAPNLDRAWVLSQYPTDRAGHRLPFFSCPHGAGGACRLPTLHHGYIHAVFQPAGHFWALQTVETAIFTGVAIALLALGAWWTHERGA